MSCAFNCCCPRPRGACPCGMVCISGKVFLAIFAPLLLHTGPVLLHSCRVSLTTCRHVTDVSVCKLVEVPFFQADKSAVFCFDLSSSVPYTYIHTYTHTHIYSMLACIVPWACGPNSGRPAPKHWLRLTWSIALGLVIGLPVLWVVAQAC